MAYLESEKFKGVESGVLHASKSEPYLQVYPSWHLLIVTGEKQVFRKVQVGQGCEYGGW